MLIGDLVIGRKVIADWWLLIWRLVVNIGNRVGLYIVLFGVVYKIELLLCYSHIVLMLILI